MKEAVSKEELDLYLDPIKRDLHTLRKEYANISEGAYPKWYVYIIMVLIAILSSLVTVIAAKGV